MNVSELFGPLGLTTFPVPPEVTYSEPAILTVAHAIAVRSGQVNTNSVKQVVDDLSPWVPIHPKEGKITKRITSYLFDKYKVTDGQVMAGRIGEYLATDLPTDGVTIDIERSLRRWEMGQFGDGRSCFRGSSVLGAMEKAGGAGLRLYNSKGNGSGRMWVLPYEGHPVLINAYGPTHDGFKGRLRVIVPDAEVHVVRAVNNGSDLGPLWVNLGIGLWVGNKGETPPDFIDFKIRCTDRPVIECSVCGREDDRHYHFTRSADNDIICTDCRDSVFGLDSYNHLYTRKDKLIQAMMVIEREGRFERGYGWTTAANLPRMQRCDRCELPMEYGAGCYVSDDGVAKFFCALCDDETVDEYKYTCRHCSRRVKTYGETCVCGRKAKYTR